MSTPAGYTCRCRCRLHIGIVMSHNVLQTYTAKGLVCDQIAIQGMKSVTVVDCHGMTGV